MQWARGTKGMHKRTKQGTLGLGAPLRAEELRARGSGFIAIYERRDGRTRLYLRQRGALRDGKGRVYPDEALAWAQYGYGWRAYAVAPFEANPSRAAAVTLRG